MSKDLADAFKKISSIVQSSAPCLGMAADICAQFAESTDACVLLADSHGKLIAQTDGEFRFREGAVELALPLYSGAERLATFTAYRDMPFDVEDIALSEAVGALLVLILGFIYSTEASAKRRDSEAVKLAIGTLSYSELSAILHVFREIEGGGLTVATRIADKLGIARSVVVTALRKLEGAGIIETRSLGVKGTYIKVLNETLLEELCKIKD
jgi:GTP-sensing transcriptional pleiotropic repressor CodY